MFKRLFTYDVTIRSTANGSVSVQAGCCTLAYSEEQIEEMISLLRRYIKNPQKVEAEYNKMLEAVEPPMQPEVESALHNTDAYDDLADIAELEQKGRTENPYNRPQQEEDPHNH